MKKTNTAYLSQAAMIAAIYVFFRRDPGKDRRSAYHPSGIHPRRRSRPVHRLSDRQYLRRSHPSRHNIREYRHPDRSLLYLSAAHL